MTKMTSFFALAAAGVVAGSAAPADPDGVDLAHFGTCADAASSRMLGQDEAQTCSAAFLRIKLSFVPGLSLESYGRLSPDERAAANRTGYEAFLDWRLRTSGVQFADNDSSTN